MSENLQTIASEQQSDTMREPEKFLMKPRLRINRLPFILVNAFKAICMVAAIFAILCMIVIAIGGLLLASHGLGGWAGVVFTAFALCGAFFLFSWGYE
jgi:uncharacterized membrane protein